MSGAETQSWDSDMTAACVAHRMGGGETRNYDGFHVRLNE